MKISGQTKTQQTLRGSISERELLAFVQQSVEIPEKASIFFYVRGAGGGEHGIDEDEPLRFTVSWDETTAPSPERTIPMRAVTTVQESKAPPG